MALSGARHSGFLPPTEAKPDLHTGTTGEPLQNHPCDLGSFQEHHGDLGIFYLSLDIYSSVRLFLPLLAGNTKKQKAGEKMCWGFPQGQEEDFPWVFPVTPVSTSRSSVMRGREDAQRCCERPQEKQLTPGLRWARGLILTHPDLCQLLALTLQQNIISQNQL